MVTVSKKDQTKVTVYIACEDSAWLTTSQKIANRWSRCSHSRAHVIKQYGTGHMAVIVLH